MTSEVASPTGIIWEDKERAALSTGQNCPDPADYDFGVEGGAEAVPGAEAFLVTTARMWGHAGENALKLMTRQTGNFRVLADRKERVKFLDPLLGRISNRRLSHLLPKDVLTAGNTALQVRQSRI